MTEIKNYYGFGSFTPKMVIATYENGKWSDITFSETLKPRYAPTITGIGYSAELFEGLKVFKGKNGKIFVHRPDDHYARKQTSCTRMMMPVVKYELFKKGIKMMIQEYFDLIPKEDNHFLYLQPRLIETEDSLNPFSNIKYDFVILAKPAYSDPESSMAVYVETEFKKSTIGSVKTSGNYGSTRLSEYKASQVGCDTVLWISHNGFIEEYSSVNFIALINDELCSPSAKGGNIIDGMTKKTLFSIAEDCKMKFSDRQIKITELVQAIEKNRASVWGCSTAKGITSVKMIRYVKERYNFPDAKSNPVLNQLQEKLLAVYKGEYLPRLTTEVSKW